MDAEPGALPPADHTLCADPASDPASTVIFEAPDPMPRFAGRSGRCVVLLPSVSGVDTTGTAAGLGLALASVQSSEVLLLDADSAPSGTGLGTRFGLHALEDGAMLPVALGLTYRPTPPAQLAGPWPRRYGVLLVHTGPGPSRDVLEEVLRLADMVLLFTPDTDTGMESAGAALRWLRAGGRSDLAERALVALACDGQDDAGPAASDLLVPARAVHRLPSEAHTMGAGVLDPEAMPDKALDALIELAREVVGA